MKGLFLGQVEANPTEYLEEEDRWMGIDTFCRSFGSFSLIFIHLSCNRSCLGKGSALTWKDGCAAEEPPNLRCGRCLEKGDLLKILPF